MLNLVQKIRRSTSSGGQTIGQFIFGERSNYYFFSKPLFYQNWKNIKNIILRSLKIKGRLLFLSSDLQLQSSMQNLAIDTNQLYSNWEHGLLTNYNFTRLAGSKKIKALKIKPSLLFVVDTETNTAIVEEARMKGIPLIYLCQGAKSKHFTYGLILNFDLKVIFFCLDLIRNICLPYSSQLKNHSVVYRIKLKKIKKLKKWKHFKFNPKLKNHLKFFKKKYAKTTKKR